MNPIAKLVVYLGRAMVRQIKAIAIGIVQTLFVQCIEGLLQELAIIFDRTGSKANWTSLYPFATQRQKRGGMGA